MREISSPLDGFASPFGPQRGFNPLRIFANDEPGVWFEANDATTLFTDVAGTTPVTTPGDAVALQLDKSQGLTLGPELVTNGTFDTDVSGWNDLSGWTGATFSSGTAVVSVTSFQGAGQALTGLTIGATYQIKATVVATTAPAARLYIGSAPNPGSSLVLNQSFLPPGDYTFNFVATATSHGIGLSTNDGGSTSTWDNISVRELPGNHRTQATVAARPLYALHPVGGVRNELVSTDTLATQDVTVTAAERTLSFKGTGTVTLSGASTAGPLAGTGAEDIASLTFTPTAGTLTLTVSGTVEEAQLELGAVRTNYQTVGSTFLDVSEEGKARRGRIWYNGTSHFMQTGTITPGTDKVQVFAGVRNNNTTASAVVELSQSAAINNGVFIVAARESLANYFFASKGTTSGEVRTGATYPAPTTNILTALGDISGDSAILRVDGVQEDISTADQGTGNYLAYPLYFGARNGTSLQFNGYEDTSIVRFGPNLDADTISKVEAYVTSKTPEETI